MNIQSLSIVVPSGKRCWNNCPFCVSRMHCENYGEFVVKDGEIPSSYLNRMQFVRDEGCNSMIITGDTEPQQNMRFIMDLLAANLRLRTPFYNIALQTTGSGIDRSDITRMAAFGLTTISLSISSFDHVRNAQIIGMPENKIRSFYDVREWASKEHLVTRASVNLTSEFNAMHPLGYFVWAQENGFDQITFRKIYASGNNPQSDWIKEHLFREEKYHAIEEYVKREGTPIMRLPFGFIKYSVHGISTVIDGDCMAKDSIDEMKYAILRPNGHLYSRWDDTGSLIF